MGTFLKIAGIVFIVLILLIILVVFVLLRKVKKWAGAMDVGPQIPSRIHLDEDLEPEWTQKDEVESIITRLHKSGFTRGDAYIIRELPEARLIGLFHEKSRVACVVYDHESFGTWVDLVVHYEDGEEMSISNAPHGGELESRPECVKFILPGAGLEVLVAELKKNSKPKPKKEINNEIFREVFEESYARDMEWRNERGGVSEEEVQRIADKMGIDLDEDKFGAVMGAIKTDEMYKWHDECMEEFRQKTTMSVAEWSKYEDEGNLFIVCDKVKPTVFIEYLYEQMEFTDSQFEQFRKLAERTESVQSLFQRINQSLSQDLRARKVGEVTKPVPADIYFIHFDD